MPTYPDISKITLPTGSTYNVKDQGARDLIAALQENAVFLGVTTTELEEGSTTNPITIDGEPVTAKTGDWTILDDNKKEFVYNGTIWQEFGDMSDLGSLAYKDSASGAYTPTGTVSTPTFTGNALTSTGKFTPSGSVSLTDTNKTATVSAAGSGETTYQPGGSVSTPTISVKTAGSTTTVNSITDVGTLPSATMPTYSVSNETLTITAGSFNAGTLPTKGSDTTVKTGDAAYQSTQPTFTGDAVRLVTGNIAVPTSASFSGNEGNISVSGTPTGTNSQPTFTGNEATITVS